MNEVISLKEAEKKVFSFATQDGLVDVFLGCLFLGWAIAPFLSSTLGDFWSIAVFVPFWGTVMFIIWLLRKYVVKSRVGAVQYGKVRKARLRKFTFIMLAINILALVAGIWTTYNYDVMSSHFPAAVFSLTVLVLFSTAAYFLDFHRLYIYGLLVCFSPTVGEWLYEDYGASHHGFPITFGVSAAVMFSTGLFVFVRLLRSNPLPDEETAHRES